MGAQGHVAAEARARALIDAQLTAAGWSVQDRRDTNLSAAPGVAVREALMAPGHGRADYLLHTDRHVVGVLEAKPAGTTLSGVEWQSAMYAAGLPADVRHQVVTTGGRPPFVLESSGTGTPPEERLRPLAAGPAGESPAAAGDTLPPRPRRRGGLAADDAAGDGAPPFGRPELPGFVGALATDQGDRAVLITTSASTRGARGTTDRVSQRDEDFFEQL